MEFALDVKPGQSHTLGLGHLMDQYFVNIVLKQKIKLLRGRDVSNIFQSSYGVLIQIKFNLFKLQVII